MEQDKSTLKAGDFVVSKIEITESEYMEVPYMRERATSGRWFSRAFSKVYDYAFAVIANSIENKAVHVTTCTAPQAKKSAWHNYLVNGKRFNVFSNGLWLHYNDFTLVVDPLCPDCNNYCKQLCFKQLKYTKE